MTLPTAIEEADRRLKTARRHTPFGHLFPDDLGPILRNVAARHGVTVERLAQAMEAQNG